MNHDLAAAISESWRRGKPWLAAGILVTVATVAFTLYMEYRDARRSVAEQKGTGLGAVAGIADPISLWQSRHGGVPAARMALVSYQADRGDQRDEANARLIVRTGKLRIVASKPAAAVDQIARLAIESRGFVANSAVAGNGNQQSAQIVVRVPAALFDQVRQQVRELAAEVQVDSVESRDVTREYTDQRATLRNLQATEEEYIALLRRAARMEDITAITEKISDVRGEIDKLEAELRLLQSQVTMSSLSVDIDPFVAAAPVVWKPLLRVRENWHNVASSFTDYADSMLALLIHLPIVALWLGTIFVALKAGWFAIRRLLRLFFPDMPLWPAKG